MNAMQATLSVDFPIKTAPSVLTASHPDLKVAETYLELTLPAGWMLRDGSGCLLQVIRGCLWLTDTRGKDLWLKDGDGERLTAKTLLTAEYETVVQLRPTITQIPFWQPRLHVNAKYQRVQLQLTALSLWQRCSHRLSAQRIQH